MLSYQQCRPHRALAPYVHYYGEMGMSTISEVPINDQVLPALGKGIIFWCHTVAPAIYVRSEYIDQSLPPAFILPQGTTSNHWLHYGGLDSFAIIFKPGKMRKLFRQPWLEAINGLIPLEDAREPALTELHERIHLATSFEERCELANNLLLSRLRQVNPQKDVIDFSLDYFHANLGGQLQQVAEQADYSTRHLNRVFSEELGIAPKAYQKVLRITAAMSGIYQDGFRKFSELAYACGFSDQAHFNRNFKSFTGLSPSAFMKQREGSANSKLAQWEEGLGDFLR